MRAFVAAMLTLVAIAAGAFFGLHLTDFSSAEQHAGDAVRLGE